MHGLQSVAPSRELRQFVRAYAQRTTGALDAELVQRVQASLEQILEFEFGTLPIIDYWDGTSEPAHRLAIVGAHSFPRASLRLSGRVESFAIFFQPMALQQLFKFPVRHLADRSYYAGDVLGVQVETFWWVLARAEGFMERVRLTESFLRSMLPVSDATVIARVAMVVCRAQGRVRVDEMATLATLSVRQFERQFERETGMPPKLFARIARFQCALDVKLSVPARTWVEIAHSMGYYDQMHLVRDFKDLSGISPTLLMTQLGDTRPPALADSAWSER